MKSKFVNQLAGAGFTLLFLALSYNSNGQAIYTESFDATQFPPPGWTVTGGTQSQWVRRTTGTNPTCLPHTGAAMARFTAFNQPSGSQEDMVSPIVDFSGSAGNTPTFSLWVYRESSSTAGDSVTIYVNTSTSVTGATRIGAVARSRFYILPINEPVDGWYQYTFNVPSSFSADTNYFILRGTSRGGGNVYVDDISWVAYPPACSGPPVAGTVLSDRISICGGPGDANLSLSGSTSGASGISYQWQTAPNDTGPWTDFGTNTPTVNTGILSASAYFRCLVSCTPAGLTDSTAALLITVSTAPNPVVAVTPNTNLIYCSGSTPLLLIASGANTYLWIPDIAIPNGIGDSALAAPTTNTIYTIIGTDTLGCSDTTTVNVQARTTPNVNALTNNDTICSGQSTNLQAMITGGPGFGIQYLWTPGNLNGANQTISPTTTTTYTVAATNAQSGCTGYDSVMITVNTGNVAAYSYSVNNLTVTFTDLSTGATSWFWDFGDGNTSTLQNPVHTYAGQNTYTVTLTVSNANCPDDVLVQSVVVGTIGINTHENAPTLILYPNPAGAWLNIEFYSTAPSATIRVLNVLGQPLVQQFTTAETNGVHRATVETRQLPRGIYQLRVETNREVSVKTFLVK